MLEEVSFFEQESLFSQQDITLIRENSLKIEGESDFIIWEKIQKECQSFDIDCYEIAKTVLEGCSRFEQSGESILSQLTVEQEQAIYLFLDKGGISELIQNRHGKAVWLQLLIELYGGRQDEGSPVASQDHHRQIIQKELEFLQNLTSTGEKEIIFPEQMVRNRLFMVYMAISSGLETSETNEMYEDLMKIYKVDRLNLEAEQQQFVATILETDNLENIDGIFVLNADLIEIVRQYKENSKILLRLAQYLEEHANPYAYSDVLAEIERYLMLSDYSSNGIITVERWGKLVSIYNDPATFIFALDNWSSLPSEDILRIYKELPDQTKRFFLQEALKSGKIIPEDILQAGLGYTPIELLETAILSSPDQFGLLLEYVDINILFQGAGRLIQACADSSHIDTLPRGLTTIFEKNPNLCVKAVSQTIGFGGVELLSIIPGNLFGMACSQSWNVETSQATIGYLIRHEALQDCPVEIIDSLTLSAEAVIALVEQAGVFKLTADLEAKLKDLRFTSNDVVSLLNFAIRQGSMQSLEKRLGSEKVSELLERTLPQIYLERLLKNSVHEGWRSVPAELRDFLIYSHWERFEPTWVMTKDTQAIAQMAQASGLDALQADSFIDFSNTEFAPFEATWDAQRAAFVGCPDYVLTQVLDSQEFQRLYSDYHEYYKQYWTASRGEKALIIRAAYKGISVADVKKLISLSRGHRLYQLFESTSILSNIDAAGIYFEEYLGFTERELEWEDSLDIFLKGEHKPFSTTADLIEYIYQQSRSDSSYEAVFYLLDLAERQAIRRDSEKLNVLEEAEKITHSDYLSLLLNMFNVDELDGKIIEELEVRAGINESNRTELYARCLDQEVVGSQRPATIKGIIERGNLSADIIRNSASKYLDGPDRKSGVVIGFFFHFLEDTEKPYSLEEKKEIWSIFWQDTIDKENIRGRTLAEFKVFAGVLNEEEYRDIFEEYLINGAPNDAVFEYLLRNGKYDQDELKNCLKGFIKDAGYNCVQISRIIAILDHCTSLGESLETEFVQKVYSLYCQRKDIEFRDVRTLLDHIGSQVEPESARQGFLIIARRGRSIPEQFVEVSKQYAFTRKEYREFFTLALQHQNFIPSSFKGVLSEANYSEEELEEYVSDILGQEKYLHGWMLNEICQLLDANSLRDIYKQYLLEADHLHKDYLEVLGGVLKTKDDSLHQLCWEEVRNEEPRYRFFQNTELLRQQRKAVSDEFSRQGYMFLGCERKESDVLHEDHRSFYRTHLVFSENKGHFSQEQVKGILGDDLYEELLQVKEAAVLETQESLWFFDREQSLGQEKVMGHGTGQVNAREATLRKEDGISARDLVPIIVQGDDGLRIAHLKATAGAFFSNDVANALYGRVEDGTRVLFFTEDALKAHMSVTTDPEGADGLVARDRETNLLVQVPNRVLLNPQSGKIVVSMDGKRVSLDDRQMTNYILAFRHALEQHPDLLEKIEKAGLDYEAKVGISEDSTIIRSNMQAHHYPESSILWAEDLYLKLHYSEDSDDRKFFMALRKIVKAVSKGKDFDVKGVFEDMRRAWTLGLNEQYSSLTTVDELVYQTRKLLIKEQRKEYSRALQMLTDPEGKRIGVARQLLAQQESARKHGDIRLKSQAEILELNRAIFMDSQSEADYHLSLMHASKLAKEATAIKKSVLRTTFDRGVASLSEEDQILFSDYRDRIAVCASGSVGREEVVISSDLDYLIFLDETDLEEKEIKLLKRLLFDIGLTINQLMSRDFHVRPDAGLANRDRQPIVPLSKIKAFEPILGAGRQMVEPSEIIDAASVDGENDLVARFKENFLQRNQDLIDKGVDSIADYMWFKVDEFSYKFKTGLSQVLSRDLLMDFKLQMQRFFQFKLQALLADLAEVDDGIELPSSSIGKIELLRDKGFIDEPEACDLIELQLLYYRLRYRADVLNSAKTAQLAESKGNTKDKITASLDPRSIGSIEAERMIDLLVTLDSIKRKSLDE